MEGNSDKYRALRAAGWLTQFGLNMISPIILCVIIALWVKNKFNTGSWVVILAIVLGVCSSVLNMITFIKTVNKEIGGKKHDEECKD